MKHLKRIDEISNSKIFEADEPVKTRTPNFVKGYEKSVVALNKMKAKLDSLNAEYIEMRNQTNKAYSDTLVSFGFIEEKEHLGHGDYNTIYKLFIPGGVKFSNGKFQLQKTHENKIFLSYKDKDVKSPMRILEIRNLNNIKKVIAQLKKDPLKALDNLKELLVTLDASKYQIEDYDKRVAEIKSNFYTGRKSAKDVKLMRPKEIMDKFKIPNVSYQSIEGKRSTVFDRETYYLADNMSFFRRFKEYFEKYGKPTKITTEKFDTREDNYEYESEVRGEREWSYSIGTKVILSFKGENDRIVTLGS